MRLSSTLTGVIIACILLLSLGIVKNSIQIYEGQKRLLTASQKVETLEKQQQALLQEKTKKESPEYLDKQIRDKLKLVKPGETLLLLPAALKDKKEDNSFKYRVEEEEQPEPIPVWKEWLKLFQ